MNRNVRGRSKFGLWALLLAGAAFFAAPSVQAQSWAPVAGGFQGGFVRGLTVPSLFNATATGDSWAAVYYGGMFKQAAGSSTWTPINNGLTDKRVYAFSVVTGVSPYRAYAATRGGGVYKTVDGGANWTATNSGLGCVYVNSVTFFGLAATATTAATSGVGSTASTDRLLASTQCGTNSGVYLSTDGGANWTLTSGMNAGVTVVGVTRVNPATGIDFLLASTYDGIYKSTDNGLTWTASSGAITNPNGATPNINNVSWLYNGSPAALTLYATEANSGVWKSADQGASWSLVFNKITTSSGVVTDGNGNGNLYFAVDGEGVYKSADQGATWTLFASAAALPGARIVQRNTTVVGSPIFYAQTYAGVYQSTDSGVTWNKTSVGLPGGYTINAVFDSSGQAYVAGAEGVFKDPPNNGPMQRLGGYNLGFLANGGHVLLNSTDVPYAITFNLGVFKFDGTNWVAKNVGLPSMTRNGSQLRADPKSATGLYLGLNRNGMYYSADGGETWTARNNGLTGGALNIRHMATTPTYTLIATGDGLYKSTDSGATWTRLPFAAKSPSNVELPIDHLRVDGGSGNIYAAVYQTSSAGVTYPGSGIWKSTDGGNTWTQSLAGKQTHEISVARTSTGVTLYAGLWDAVGGGAMQSTDEGATWTAINAGLTSNYVGAFAIAGGVMKGVTTLGEGPFSFNPAATASSVNYDQIFIGRNKNLPSGAEGFGISVRYPRQANDQLKSAVLACPGAASTSYTFSGNSTGYEWFNGASYSSEPATPFNCTSTVTYIDNTVNSQTVTVDRFSPANYYVTNISLQPNANVATGPAVTWSAPTATPPSSGFVYQSNIFTANFSAQAWFVGPITSTQATYSGPGLTAGSQYQLAVTTIEGAGTNLMHAAQTWTPFCYQCGTTTGSASTMNFLSGWNLAGNGSSGAIDVATVFGDKAKVNSVWKWVGATSKWAFYAPSQIDGGASYANGKGYDFLTSVAGGEGFWVNAGAAFTAPLPTGTAVSSGSFQSMPSGWNLIAIGDGKTPSGFNTSLSTSPPSPGVTPLNLTSLWAWDATKSNWYFYAPSLEAKGGTSLTDYITSKNYLDFGTATLGPTAGFWVNKP